MRRAGPLAGRRWIPWAILGLALAIAQLLLTDPRRGPSWDEAIYLSQLRGPALLFAPQRARGSWRWSRR